MSKKRFFVMTRQGTFIPEDMSPNQCGRQGVTDYTYEIKCVLKDKLDFVGFCIDHDHIQESIEQTTIEGSCEEMQKLIYKKVRKTFTRQNVKLLAYSCKIIPKGKKKSFPASIRYFRGKRKYIYHLIS